MTSKQPNSRMCFVCGLQNPVGLHMSIYNDHDNHCIYSLITVPDQSQSYPGVVHGGILATMLDEVSGRAIIIDGNDENLMVTMKLEVKYRRPTPTNTPLKVVGRVVSQTETRAKVEGEIQLPDGTVTASCESLLARPPEEMRTRWENEKQYWRVYPDA
ncbi:MAG TPA: PaaI family thioesterase [Anaerolineae bacterium]|nr:PaaI family thioesterase [Anaerolineae bacterium]